MEIKKKLGMSLATAGLGLALIAGGTFAYFSDAEETNNTFAAGTLDLSVDPTTIVNVDNLKPGDTVVRAFELINNGSLDISSIDLSTSYTVDDAKGDNQDDFGKHIKVLFLENADKTGDGWVIGDYNDVISETTLYDLQNMTPDAVENLNSFWTWLLGLGGEDSGLQAGDSDQMFVAFEFVDNGKDQNEFQGDALQLTWTFNAHQTEGELR
ncbi:CalY family protein [Ornithinibacillus bavariensis]|uniref:Cell division protein FtsN n=1 Tax=Ornithinibacillus bavariensis TaxID=545502 RepID=A0A919X5T3_9BACI|nr:CalY family protein [Ornithinibacillus bavariensis]GIO26451.1 cell division protein FtsN [Ornithinibacillus bavariensis]HAM81672.1 cell division protein FtsN [Ornithinibacillus sp.]